MRLGINLSLVFATWLGSLIHSTFSNPTNAPRAPSSQSRLCPDPCYKTGPNPSHWNVFSDVRLISGCARPILLDFSLHAPSSENLYVRSCDAWGTYYDFKPAPKISPASDEKEANVTAQMAWSPSPQPAASSYVAVTLLREVEYQLLRSTTPWDKTVLFGAFQGMALAVYVGDNFLNPSAVDALFKPLIEKVSLVGMGLSKALIQVCGDEISSDQTFGVIVLANGTLADVHDAALIWSRSQCINTTTFAESARLDNLPVRIKPRFSPQGVVRPGTPTRPNAVSRETVSAAKNRLQRRVTTLQTRTESEATTAIGTAPTPSSKKQNASKPAAESSRNAAPAKTNQRGLASQASESTDHTVPISSAVKPTSTLPPGQCQTLKVFAGDTCDSLAKNCKISRQELAKFNPDFDLCKSTYEGQLVCCSAGKLPHVRPKQNADGSCFVYDVKMTDTCESIAAVHGLDLRDLERLNYDTWGWPGCKALRNGIKICLTKGHPPMPAPISNAVCGPQKPGTPVAAPGTDLSTLNPCPLNACCNSMGQCGVTEDFCTSTQGSGSPGTGKNGTIACISNCGIDVRSGDPPRQFINMTYFDGYNLGRDCLNMDIKQVDKSYTHIHFAFGHINSDFGVEFKDEYSTYLFDQLTKLRGGPKRVLSFGEWTFSSKSSFYPVFRDGIKPKNREKFASSISKFADITGLDGVDFVWETPGAPSVPGVPPRDNPNEGADYAAFLKLLRSKLDKGKTLSIAAPASYWYLMQFPIKEISKTVDYIVYMTNNLQKQWDSVQKFNDPSCPTNDCLRNPLHIADTWTALIVVVLTSYGQSFKLADPSCTDPLCHTKGKRDEASKHSTRGLCTNAAGRISNAEIDLVSKSFGNKAWYDQTSDTQMLLYDKDSWVSFMTSAIKESRKKKFKNLNLGGTADFAVDLDAFHDAAELSWETAKHNIKFAGRPDACDWELRTGTWVNRTCVQDEVAAPFNYTKYQRWLALDADSAWNDAKARWLYCDKEKIQFTQSVTQFFHANENAILKNYASILRDAATQVESTKNEFMDTFAPERDNDDASMALNILLTLTNVPTQVMGSGFFKIFVNNLKYFKANPIQADAVKDLSMQLVSASLTIGAKFIKSETAKEATFRTIFDSLIKKWGEEVDSMVVNLFSGSDETIARLGKLIEHGKMIPGAPEARRRDLTDEHTDNFIQEKVVERVFWSAAIPMVWRMRRPDASYPVILDFGPGCESDIGSRKYWFSDQETSYNKGFVCYQDHSAMLWSPPGLDSIQTPTIKFANVTIEDLVVGSVATWERNGRLNIMDPTTGGLDLSNRDDFDNLWENTIRAPGHIRIPVCSPQEATHLAKVGTKNLPPDVHPSFPCFRDPSKGLRGALST
ncbi:hypothetical protein E4U53_000009 [Claviceps sorghi]|nr:hypothetical protein E4U53_000009 [Claviceps sorghi]